MYPQDDVEVRLQLMKRRLSELRERIAREVARSRELRERTLRARPDAQGQRECHLES